MKFSTKFIAATREYADFGREVPAPLFRKVFTASAVKNASVTICGLGFYRLFVNGKELTRGLLSPYISNPDDIMYYDSYDISDLLQDGENVIGVMLGNGMQNAFGGAIWDFHLARFRSAPKLALAVEMTSESGEESCFEADESFMTASSPILMDDLRAGEFYDARREDDIKGWMTAGFDASAWHFAIPAETPRGICRLCDVSPILPERELSAVSIRRTKAVRREYKRASLPKIPLCDEELQGFLYDFGVNAAGIVRLKINGKRGQKISLQFGEDLSEDGRLMLEATSFLPDRYGHRIEYTCKGGEEEYLPSFTYFGFRYCLVSGIDETEATKELLTYIVMNTKMEPRGTFSCSDEMANKIFDAVMVSDKANFYHFPTDCPHREKNGWTGDAALSAEQMLYFLSPERNFKEWMRNISLAQRADGALPGIVPTGGWGFNWGNGPAWDTILVTLPYFVWRYRGDTEILEIAAPSILRYLYYLNGKRDEKGLIHIGLGDWCHSCRKPEQPKTSLAFTDTVVCMDICRKAKRIFEVLGKSAEASYAESVCDSLRAAARAGLLTEECGVTADRTETSQAMAIFYDVFEPCEKETAFKVLLDIIEEEGNSIDCGILGLRVLFHVLSEYGRTDLAYHMITKKELPSYGYMIENGATALWEQFPAFGKKNVTSFNHHFFGDVAAWFAEELAGIQMNPEEKGVDTAVFAPKFIDALDFAAGSHESPFGRLSADWHREGEKILYTVSVPEGMQTELRLEKGYALENGERIIQLSAGVTRFEVVREG